MSSRTKRSNSWNDMSLMRFLTVGKSLNPVKQTQSPYRLGGGLPKFNAANPFQKEKAKTQPIPAGEVLPRANVTFAKQQSDQAQQSSLRTKILETRAKVVGFSAVAISAFSKTFTKRSRSSVGRKLPTSVQVELSLDKVKVLRNDLSDADLEVVSVESTKAARKRLSHRGENVFSAATNSPEVGEMFQLEETQTQ
jgi:hypothetical protein